MKYTSITITSWKCMLPFILVSAAYTGLGHRGNSMSREIQTLLSPVTSTTSFEGTLRCSQICREYNLFTVSLVSPGVSSRNGMPETPP